MPPSMLASPGARALLIACGRYSSADWPSISTAIPTMDRFGDLLRDRCGMRPHGVIRLRDPATPREVIRAVGAAARDAADDILLLYVVGHATTDRGGQLRLILAESDGPEESPVEALYSQVSFQNILDAAATSDRRRPRTVVAILDCCGAGRVAGNDFSQFQSHYLMAAVEADRLAMAPPDQPYTAFSSRIIRLLNDGAPQFGESIRLTDFADELRKSVRPLPVATGTAYYLTLAANPHPQALPQPKRAARSSAVPTGKCPYPGLTGFSARERAWFRGRERAIEEAIIPLTDIGAPLLPRVISGPSGSGKSSFIRAGLLPALEEYSRDYATRFRVVTIPEPTTARPLQALARQLSNELGPPIPYGSAPAVDVGELEGRLCRGLPEVQSVADEVMAAIARARPPAQELLIVVDQFEKVFARDVAPAERAAFVSALCDLAQTPPSSAPVPGSGFQDRVSGRVRVLLAVQSEYITLLADADDRLRKALTGNHFILAPLTRDELERAIVEPAEMEGVTPDPDLVARMCAEFTTATETAQDNMGNLQPPRLLPHLAEALRITWHYSRHLGFYDRLILDAYERSGKLGGAIAQTAEQCFLELEAKSWSETARQLLLCLVQYEGEHHYEIKTVHRQDLVRDLSGQADRDECDQVLGKLRGYALVTEGSTGVALVHQVLLSAWPRMARWLEEDEAWQTARERIQNGARKWEASGERLTDDIVDLPLADDYAAAAQRGDRSGLGDHDWAYLEAGLKKQHALARRQRWARWSFRSFVVLAVAALAAVAFVTHYAGHEKQSAALGQAEDTSDRLASAAGAMRLNAPLLAARLAVAAYRSAPTTQAWSALLSTAAQAGPTAVSNADTSRLSGPQVSVSDSLVAAPTASNLIAIDRVSDGRPTMTLPDSQSFVADLVFDHDGSLLAGASQNGSVRIWDVQKPAAAPRDIQVTSADPRDASVSSLTFSEDDSLIAIAYSFNSAQAAEVWRLSPDSAPVHLVTLPSSFAEFTGNGNELAVVDSEGNWRLQSPDTMTDPGSVGMNLPQLHKADPDAVCFSPHGDLMADSSPETTYVWATNSTSTQPISSFASDSGACVFSRDGTMLVLSGVEIWDLGKPDHPSLTTVLPAATQSGSPIVGTAQFSPDQRLLAVPGDSPHVWDISGLSQPGLNSEIPSASTGQAPVAANSLGTLIATGTSSGTVAVWSTTSPGDPTRLGVIAPPAKGPMARQPVTALSFATGTGELTITYGSVGRSIWDVSGHSFVQRSARVVTGLLDPTNPPTATSPYRNIVATGSGSAVNFATGPDSLPDMTVVPQPGASVTTLAFDRNGDVLAVGTDQGDVVLLMLRAHRAPVSVATLPSRRGAITGVAFGPNETLMVAAKDGMTLVSSLDPADLIRQACATPLTPQVTSNWSLYTTGGPDSACSGT